MIKKSIISLMLVVMMIVISIFPAGAQDLNSMNKSKIKTTANGIVVDMETGLPISNATITYSEVDGNRIETIKTNEDGNFYINSIETGYYNWKVEGDTYNIGLFNGYPNISGGNNYFFEISKSKKVELNYKRQVETIGCVDVNDDDEYLYNKDNTPMGVPQDPPVIPRNVTVKTASGTIVPLQLEDYIFCVLYNEMNPDYFIYDDMTNSQKMVMLEAQAITARSYTAFHFYKKDRHPGQSYQFCNSTHCQVYERPVNLPTLCINATNNTSKEIMIKIIDNYNWIWNYVDAVFSASCKGYTKNNEDVWGGAPVSYLRSVSCPYDIRPNLSFGHNLGLCQDGAAGYAKNGYSSTSILLHYFSGVSIKEGQY